MRVSWLARHALSHHAPVGFSGVEEGTFSIFFVWFSSLFHRNSLPRPGELAVRGAAQAAPSRGRRLAACPAAGEAAVLATSVIVLIVFFSHERLEGGG